MTKERKFFEEYPTHGCTGEKLAQREIANGKIHRLRCLIDDQEAELARLREEREEARDIVRALCSEMWLGFSSIESEDVQNVIDKAGLFVEVPASPEVKAEWDTDTMQMLKWDAPAGGREG